MSWSGTVYCRYCGCKGHNRRGCAQRKEYIANNPDSWQARRAESDAHYRKNNPRTCSYCRHSGHNARKCSTKNEDQSLLNKMLKESRATVMEKMLALGFGIGTLVEVQGHWTNTAPYLGLVTTINWGTTDSIQGVDYCITALDTNMPRWGKRPLEEDSRVTVVSPIDKEKVEGSFPYGWQLGLQYDEEKYFPKGDRRQPWVNDITSKKDCL